MNTLMHICCAPCASQPIAALREEGVEVTGFWYNPNIHPYTEYRSRRQCLEDYAREIALPLVMGGEYGLREFIGQVAGDMDARCLECYRMRMQATAQYAAQHGFERFTTSLLISPYQNFQAIVQQGHLAGAAYGVAFLERDFRDLFRQGQDFGRDHGFYMQKYCGCIFSEEERYRKKKKPRPSGG